MYRKRDVGKSNRHRVRHLLREVNGGKRKDRTGREESMKKRGKPNKKEETRAGRTLSRAHGKHLSLSLVEHINNS
jgi:hypothetical protein